MKVELRVTKHRCERCNHEWVPRKHKTYPLCPKCHKVDLPDPDGDIFNKSIKETLRCFEADLPEEKLKETLKKSLLTGLKTKEYANMTAGEAGILARKKLTDIKKMHESILKDMDANNGVPKDKKKSLLTLKLAMGMYLQCLPLMYLSGISDDNVFSGRPNESKS